MSKRRFPLILASFVVLLFVSSLVAYAQDPTPAAPPSADSGIGVVLPAGALKIALAILAQGLLVSKMIDGLKNTPGIADFFAKHGWAAAVANALVSFFVATPLCFAATGHVDLNCLAAAFMTFFSSAGFHLARVKANAPAVIDARGKVSDAPSPSVTRKTLDDLGIKPIK
jgi:hypothetical protein